MVLRSLLLSCMAVLSLGGAAPSAADEPRPAAGRLLFAVGWYDFNLQDDDAVDLRVEYRAPTRLAFVRPFGGIELTTDGAVYLLGGFYADVEMTRRWRFTPSAGAGIYHDGGGKELGTSVEFRTQAEFSYRLNAADRLAISVSHISNADLGPFNPGTEILSFGYSIPVGKRRVALDGLVAGR